MMSREKKSQKLHTNDASLATQSWVVPLIGCATREIASTNEKHYPALGNDTSSGSNVCAPFSNAKETSVGITESQLFS